MSKTDQESLYSNRHPHFTPQWLSERLASHLPKSFVGTVTDPACGSGNLLAAAALRLRVSSSGGNDIRFYGCDISIRAVRECRRMLKSIMPTRCFTVAHKDFLTRADSASISPPVAVVMNPPFCGYGELSKSRREHVRQLLEAKGRFNLAHAFVQHSIARLRPQLLISLLPSNWVYSPRSDFRAELRRKGGKWEWEDLDAKAFHGIALHMGILVWRQTASHMRNQKSLRPRVTRISDALDIRQGVATGRDAQFGELAALHLPFGRRMPAVRGRDVTRGTTMEIWVPPRLLTQKNLETLAVCVPVRIRRELNRRSSVQSKRKKTFEYHESMPKWFIGKPKILIPEIVTGEIRAELDISGVKLPLHSVIAIKMPTLKQGRELLRYLRSEECQRRLTVRAPRLINGSTRMQVGAIRHVVEQWRRKKRLQQD